MSASVPPGRAGRLWLLARLEVARRAAELLERKERLLRSEERRLLALAERTGSEWQAAWEQAALWTARAVVVGGRAALAGAVVPPAEVELRWRNTMGLTYPVEAACHLSPTAATAAANPALPGAVSSNRRAAAAAVAHAAADYARSEVQAELAVTRRRRRAITEHWIPELVGTLASLEARLDELEQQEHVRTRWAARAIRR